ncbi:MAG: hypothetical protein U0132_23055 [Gemmatimonadaceae bacterium]
MTMGRASWSTFGRLSRIGSGVLVLFMLTTGHVGNPDTVQDGQAGPFRVRVIVRAPTVIPQQAEVIVRVLDGAPVRRITASARFWDAGEKGAPPPDEAQRVPGDSALWTVRLWLMRQGSYAITVHAEGDAGNGSLLVPLTATAVVIKPMTPGLGVLLAVLVTFLALSLTSIVAAGVREASLEGGEAPTALHRAAAVRARLVTGGIVLSALVGVGFWWRDVDRQHRAFLFRPSPMTVTTQVTSAATTLRVSFKANVPRRRAKILTRPDEGSEDGAPPDRTEPLIPDHGKLMHLFVVRADNGFLAHLHPVRNDSGYFETNLPPLAPGPYLLFADVLQQSGFTQTLVARDSLQVTTASWVPTDPDDAIDDPTHAAWPAGLRIESNNDSTTLVAGRDVTLAFTVRDASGLVAQLDPYLGMAGHAVIVRAGGDVFAHVHPSGTTSMAAQQALSLSAQDTGHAMPEVTFPGVLHFPFVFPKAGAYRVWVQFRAAGGIRTVPFDLTIQERAP